MIELSHIFYQYGKTKVLENINIKFSNKGLYIIKGESGSGKTTLLNLISGKLQKQKGEILINGIPQKEIKNYRSIFSTMEQKPQYIDNIKVRELIEIATDEDHKDKISDFCNKYQLNKLIKKKVNELSGGEKARLFFVISIINEPGVLILDEPTASLDKLATKEINKAIIEYSQNHLVIYNTHKFEGLEQYPSFLIKDKQIISNNNIKIAEKLYVKRREQHFNNSVLISKILLSKKKIITLVNIFITSFSVIFVLLLHLFQSSLVNVIDSVVENVVDPNYVTITSSTKNIEYQLEDGDFEEIVVAKMLIDIDIKLNILGEDFNLYNRVIPTDILEYGKNTDKNSLYISYITFDRLKLLLNNRTMEPNELLELIKEDIYLKMDNKSKKINLDIFQIKLHNGGINNYYISNNLSYFADILFENNLINYNNYIKVGVANNLSTKVTNILEGKEHQSFGNYTELSEDYKIIASTKSLITKQKLETYMDKNMCVYTENKYMHLGDLSVYFDNEKTISYRCDNNIFDQTIYLSSKVLSNPEINAFILDKQLAYKIIEEDGVIYHNKGLYNLLKEEQDIYEKALLYVDQNVEQFIVDNKSLNPINYYTEIKRLMQEVNKETQLNLMLISILIIGIVIAIIFLIKTYIHHEEKKDYVVLTNIGYHKKQKLYVMLLNNSIISLISILLVWLLLGGLSYILPNVSNQTNLSIVIDNINKNINYLTELKISPIYYIFGTMLVLIINFGCAILSFSKQE